MTRSPDGRLAVAKSRRRWVTAAALALHVTVVAVVYRLFAKPWEFWQGLAVVVTLDAAMIASGLLVRSRRLLVASTRERAREAEEGLVVHEAE